MANLMGQEAVHIGLVINPNKTKSLAITIRQPPAADYNWFSIKLSGWDIEQMAIVSYLSCVIDSAEVCSKKGTLVYQQLLPCFGSLAVSVGTL